MDDSQTIRSSPRIHKVIVLTSLAIVIFLFWLALSTNSLVALVPAALAIMICGATAAIIKKPFTLIMTNSGLFIETPFGDSYYAWESVESFSIRRADPLTLHIVYKLRPAVKSSRLDRFFHPIGFDGSLFPYFEIDNDQLLALIRERHLRGRVRILV